jgi:hypothetical protein
MARRNHNVALVAQEPAPKQTRLLSLMLSVPAWMPCMLVPETTGTEPTPIAARQEKYIADG